MKIEHKHFGFACTEVKQEDRNGVPVGIIEGYASTWDIDRGDDVIMQGAFADSIKRHSEDGRPIRMLYQHNGSELIGGFPIHSVREDEKGLYVKGEINLDVQKGREAYALAKQGVLTDMSIGFSIASRDDVDFRDDGEVVVRTIKRVELWEISMVGEPMNPKAKVVNVKNDSGKFEVCDVEQIKSKSEYREFLKGIGIFSNNAVEYLTSCFKSEADGGEHREADLWNEENTKQLDEILTLFNKES